MEKIPECVKVSPKELCLNGYEISSKYIGKQIYVMMIDNDVSLDIVACPCPHLKSISFYANYFRVFQSDFEQEEVIIAKVRVVDPANLPFEISEKETIFLIYEDWYLMEHDSMEDTAFDIEDVINNHENAKISDFCVLVGNEVAPGIKKASLNLTRRLNSERKRKDAEEYVLTTT